MAKKENKPVIEPFTMVKEWYYECDLNLLEIAIISRIASWQREGKEFYEGYDTLAIKFKNHYNTVRNTFLKLEKMKIIYRNGKHRRAWKWKINEVNLSSLHSNTKSKNEHSNTTCKNDDTFLQPELEILTPGVSYHINKTSNKTSFKEEDILMSSSKEPKRPEITEADILALDLNDI